MGGMTGTCRHKRFRPLERALITRTPGIFTFRYVLLFAAFGDGRNMPRSNWTYTQRPGKSRTETGLDGFSSLEVSVDSTPRQQPRLVWSRRRRRSLVFPFGARSVSRHHRRSCTECHRIMSFCLGLLSPYTMPRLWRKGDTWPTTMHLAPPRRPPGLRRGGRVFFVK
ncbi:hypothetical protein LZ30DRAFT_696758 [Colletotrichum cereale]|nr:hypothetical protein LZ30DRAFT_696758 [Colletotrichum cereale]